MLRAFPQLALAVLLMAAGVPGGDRRRSRIELEVLYPDDAALEEVDPGVPATVDEARQVIADLAGPWSSDTSYQPEPGRDCAQCEVLDWCRPGRAHLSAASPR